METQPRHETKPSSPEAAYPSPNFAAQAVWSATQQVVEGINYGLENNIELGAIEKKAGDRVTDVDQWANSFLRFHLEREIRDYDIYWLSEDSGSVRDGTPKPPQNNKPTFFVDPWDGTNAFFRRYKDRLKEQSSDPELAQKSLISGASICLAYVNPEHPKKNFAIVGMPFTPDGPVLYQIDASGVKRYEAAEDGSMGPAQELEMPQVREGVEHGVIMSRATRNELGDTLDQLNLTPVDSELGGAAAAIAMLDPKLRKQFIREFDEENTQIVANVMRGYPWDCATGYVLSVLHGLIGRRWDGTGIDIYAEKRGAVFRLPGAEQIMQEQAEGGEAEGKRVGIYGPLGKLALPY